MPRLERFSHAIDSITLPKSGVKITLRRNATGRDKAEAMAAARADDLPGNRQTYFRYLGYMAASLMEEWDAVDEDEKPIPISPQELFAMREAEDYEYLLYEVLQRTMLREEADPEKEDPFVQSSSQSSPDMSSKTPTTTPSSSTSSS